jgi:signal transduction histidine kinase
MFTLLVEESHVTLVKYELEKEVTTIGRSVENDIIIKKNGVSRQHAKIEVIGNTPVIKDLQSKNGTRVNGVRIDEKILHDGDEIILGDAILTFKLVAGSKSVQFSDLNGKSYESTTKFVKPAKELLDSIESAQMPTIEEMVDTTYLIKEDYERLNLQYKFLNNLYQVTKAINSSMEIKNLLNMIIDKIMDATSAERGFLMTIDENSNELIPQVVRSQYGTEIQISKTIIDNVVKDGVSILTLDAAKDERFKEAESIILYGIHSAMCVPLIYENKIIGVIHVDRTNSPKPFREEDLKLLTAIAHQAVIAIQRSWLIHELEVKNKELKTANKKQGVDLIRAEKAKVIGYYAAGMRHHFRQPITVIMNGVDLLKENCEEVSSLTEEISEFVSLISEFKENNATIGDLLRQSDKYGNKFKECKNLINQLSAKEEDASYIASDEGGLKRTFEDIKSSVIRINNIIDVMNRYTALDVSEIEEIVSATNINQDIEDFLIIFDKNLQGVKVFKDLDMKIPLIGCYARELKTALLKILENTFDFMEKKKKATTNYEPRIDFWTHFDESKREVTIKIKDNGIGVPERLKRYVFDAFVSTRDESNAGLGLFIARDIIVNMHGGDINLNSVENEYTEVIMKIPIDPKPSTFRESH